MATSKKKKNVSKRQPRVRTSSRRRTRATDALADEAAVERPELSLMEGMERLNRVLSKTIELAEAALQLGVRLVDNMGRGGRAHPAEGDSAGATIDSGVVREEAPVPPSPAPSDSRVGNRAPLRPGSEVRITFSINNDSTSKRMIALKLSPLAGEARGARMAEGALVVSPDRFSLDPFDFEKLVLAGRIPANTPPDTYTGSIVVTGADQPIVIPIRLVVT